MNLRAYLAAVWLMVAVVACQYSAPAPIDPATGKFPQHEDIAESELVTYKLRPGVKEAGFTFLRVRVSDNLQDRDPTYEGKLQMLGADALRRIGFPKVTLGDAKEIFSDNNAITVVDRLEKMHFLSNYLMWFDTIVADRGGHFDLMVPLVVPRGEFADYMAHAKPGSMDRGIDQANLAKLAAMDSRGQALLARSVGPFLVVDMFLEGNGIALSFAVRALDASKPEKMFEAFHRKGALLASPNREVVYPVINVLKRWFDESAVLPAPTDPTSLIEVTDTSSTTPIPSPAVPSVTGDPKLVPSASAPVVGAPSDDKFVTLPQDIQCVLHDSTTTFLVDTNGDLKGQISSVKAITCRRDGSEKDVPLVGIQPDGTVLTKKFGRLKVVFQRRSGGGIDHLEIQNSELKLFREFLSGK